MKTIGLIGGMSWESTSVYYSLINKGINDIFNRHHSAKCVVYSFDFQEIEELQYAGNWDELEKRIVNAGKSLKLAGAECIVLCTNTMHKVVNHFEEKVGIPLLHIADAIGEAVTQAGLKRIGLLGTVFTMEQDFYKEILQNKYGLVIIIPNKEEREIINHIIYNELIQGIITENAKKQYYQIMDKLVHHGAQGIILGCTEIGLLVKDYHYPLFDSTRIHAKKAIAFATDKN